MLSGRDLAILHEALVILRREELAEAANAVQTAFGGYSVPDGYVRFVLEEPDQANIECAAAYIASCVDDCTAGKLVYTVEWIPTTTSSAKG